MRPFLLLTLLPLTLCAQDGVANQLTSAEKKAGWTLLFDGKTFKGWDDPAGKTPAGDAWSIVDGCLKANPHPKITEDLFTTSTYRDFELQWEWKIEAGGNSGLKYRIQDTVLLDPPALKNRMAFEGTVGHAMEQRVPSRKSLAGGKSQIYVIGFEYQMIDNAAHKDAQRGGKYQTGALYDSIPASQDASRPAGEWNQSRLVVKGDRIEHWLNGKKVVDDSLKSDAIRENASRRWNPAPQLRDFLINQPKQDCPISLQNHDNNAWFRSIKLRKL